MLNPYKYLAKSTQLMGVHYYYRCSLEEISGVKSNLKSNPKIKVVGILDKTVESRRSLDEFMLVEFVCSTPIDLDVDSDNNGGSHFVEGSAEEEALENPSEHGTSFSSTHYGKILKANTGDADNDGIPDYADATSNANANQGVELKNLTAVLVKFPPANTLPPEASDIVVRFTYDSSDPTAVSGPNYDLPADGTMRLWLGDGGQPPRPKFIRNVNEIGSGGDWVKDGIWYSKADLGVSGDTATLFIESVKMSTTPADQQLKVELTYRQANGNYFALGSDTVAFTSNGISLVPDYNRDGKIDGDDKGKWQAGQKFYFWTNTDDDEGETKGDDIPGKSIETPSLFSRVNPFSSPTGDAMTKSNGLGNISGVRDLIDYFPVHIDLGNMLNNLDLDEVNLVLRGPDINFALPDAETGAIDPLTCGDYLRVVDTAKKFAELEKTRTSGDKLLTYSNDPSKDREFLEQVKLGKGVILLEGRVPTDEPLVLEVYYKGNVIASTEMNLMISEVEDMYRHVNLRPVVGGKGGRPTELDSPLGYPDSDTNTVSDKYFVLVHGYNVNAEQARGWHAEFFKRMWWSGSRARFIGVSWVGDQTKIGPLTSNYHKNVINAFNSSEHLKLALNQFQPGVTSSNQSKITIAAHSLGNMVVSSAIEDHDLWVANYFPFNAAVAMEAYNSLRPSNAGNLMIHQHWRDYDQTLWASEWHRLPWSSGDWQKGLTWRGRFGNVASKTNVVSFYSSGEEVLNNPTDDLNSDTYEAIIDDFLLKPIGDGLIGEYLWSLQELLKGRAITGGALGSNYGGWAFNYNKITGSGYSKSVLFPIPHFRKYTMEESEALVQEPDQLRTKPFFELNPSEYTAKDASQLLAQAFPTLTYALGRNSLVSGNVISNNMMHFKNPGPIEWWSDKRDLVRWRHGDIRNVAYLYTFRVFDEFTNLGQLDN